MVKKMTYLLTTQERVMVSTQLMSRLSPCSTLSPSSQMMSRPCVEYPSTRWWRDGLTRKLRTACLIFNTFNSGGSKGSVSVVMEPSYHLGPRPEIEKHIRNFLYSAFFKEQALGQGRLWLEILLIHITSAPWGTSPPWAGCFCWSLPRTRIRTCSLVSSGLTMWMPFLLLMKWLLLTIARAELDLICWHFL